MRLHALTTSFKGIGVGYTHILIFQLDSFTDKVMSDGCEFDICIYL